MTTDSWLLELLCNPFDHVIAGSYKKGSAHHCEPEMYVCNLCNQSFSTQGSLKRHQESVHRQSASVSFKYATNSFTGKTCYIDTWRRTNRRSYAAIHQAVRTSWLLAYLKTTSQETRRNARMWHLRQDLRYPENAEEAPRDHSSSIWQHFWSSVRPTLLPWRPPQEASHQKTCPWGVRTAVSRKSGMSPN